MIKKNTILTICYLILVAVGILLILGAVLLFVNDMQFRKSAARITGEISDITTYYDNDGDVHHEAFVTYTYEDITYERVRLNVYSSTMYVGESISLLYDSEHPGKVKTESGTYIAVIILTIMGVVFLGIGIILLVLCIQEKNCY